MFASRKMHDICMREAGTKFQLSHIDDVGEGGREGADLCIYAENSSHMCSLHCSVLTLKIFTKIRVAICTEVHAGASSRLMPVHNMKL